MPTQGRSARGKKITEWSKNESVANHSAMGWAESVKWGVKTPAIVHGRVRDDVEKKNVNEQQQQNEEPGQMKIQHQK